MSILIRERKISTVKLINKLLANILDGIHGKVSHTEPITFDELAEGVVFYRILHYIDPQAFGAMDEIEELNGKDQTDDLAVKGATNWVLRRELLTILVRHMNDYAHRTLGAADSLDLSNIIDFNALATEVASSLTTDSVCDGSADPSQSVENEGSKGEPLDGGPLLQIAGFFNLMVVLSGMPEILQQIKSLPRVQQVTLSKWAKEVIAKHNLKPLQRYGGSTSEELPTPSRQQTFPSPRHSLETSASLASVQPPSLMWPPAASTTQLSDESPTGGPIFHARVSSLVASSALLSTSAADPTLLGVEDSYYRSMTQQLRSELEESKGMLREAEAKLRLCQEDRQGWESKYRHLLAEQAPRGGATQDSADFLRRLFLKDEAITTLKRTVDEQAAKLSAFKDATTAQMEGFMTLKGKIKTLQEELLRKSNERREAIEKLAIAEDKLVLQIKSRQDLENEVEELRSQLTLLQLSNQGKQQGGKDDEDNPTRSLSLSFGSNTSVDRMMQLENELDDVRTQRNTLQRQLLALQRQVATMPPALADPTAVTDTLRAHLRQLEREKEQLHKELSEVLERVEFYQGRKEADKAGAETGPLPGSDGPAAAGADARPPSDSPVQARKPSEASQREVVLSSLLLQYGYRNLLLQQHQLLLHGDRSQAEVALAERRQAMGAVGGSKGGNAGFSGSLLTRQRHEVEQGLLETVIHGRSPLPPPRVPAPKTESSLWELNRWWGGTKKSESKNYKRTNI